MKICNGGECNIRRCLDVANSQWVSVHITCCKLVLLYRVTNPLISTIHLVSINDLGDGGIDRQLALEADTVVLVVVYISHGQDTWLIRSFSQAQCSMFSRQDRGNHAY